jgi:hypothetical protein
MFQRKTFTSLALIMRLAATPAIAQQQEEHQQHPPPGPSSSAMSQRGPGITGGGMPMTNMMRMMMGREEMGSMGMMAGDVEGRLAF